MKSIKKKICLGILCVLLMVTVGGSFVINTQAANGTEKVAYVWLGDSRTVGLNNVMALDEMEDTFVIAKVGMGYNWLKTTAFPELVKFKNEHKYDRYVVLCNLGVNDLGNVENYISFLPEFEKIGVDLYWISVNPTIDSVKGVQCSAIETFNTKLKENFDTAHWIESYQYLKTVGYSANDGLHYDAATYRVIYYYVMMELSTREYLAEHELDSSKLLAKAK